MKTGISVLGIRMLGEGGELVLLDVAKGRTGVVKFTELNWFEEFIGPLGVDDDLPLAMPIAAVAQLQPMNQGAAQGAIDPFFAQQVKDAIGVKR